MGKCRRPAYRHRSQHPFQRRRAPDEASSGRCEKGAFDEAEAQKRFDAWKAKKQQAVDNLKTTMASKKELAAKERLEAEKAKNAAKAEEVAKKKAEIAAAKAAEEAAAAAPAEEAATEEAPAEAAE